MSTWVSLTGGKAWALQLDGIIYRTGSVAFFILLSYADPIRTANGNMIYVGNSDDFEMYSSTSKGAMQGYGYVFHAGSYSKYAKYVPLTLTFCSWK
jgi:rhamnogalacturonan hydrolase